MMKCKGTVIYADCCYFPIAWTDRELYEGMFMSDYEVTYYGVDAFAEFKSCPGCGGSGVVRPLRIYDL